jgi:tRNA nucleotidyltransferase/poly(A) polymerase
MVYKVFKNYLLSNEKLCLFILDISGERLWVELKRIAEGRNAGPVLKVMLEQDTSQYLGRILMFNISSFFCEFQIQVFLRMRI